MHCLDSRGRLIGLTLQLGLGLALHSYNQLPHPVYDERNSFSSYFNSNACPKDCSLAVKKLIFEDEKPNLWLVERELRSSQTPRTNGDSL